MYGVLRCVQLHREIARSSACILDHGQDTGGVEKPTWQKAHGPQALDADAKRDKHKVQRWESFSSLNLRMMPFWIASVLKILLPAQCALVQRRFADHAWTLDPFTS